MKLDIVKTLIAISASALIAFGQYSWCVSDKAVLLSLFSFIETSAFLISALGLQVEWLRSMANVKVISWIFFFIELTMNIVFSRKDFSLSAFIVSNGCVLLFFFLIQYSLIKVNKNH